MGGGVFSNVVDVYDNSTNTWSTATLSQARENIKATSIGTKAFFGGGYFGGFSNVVDIYDSGTNTWSTATLSQGRTGLTATSVGSKAFFAGGESPSSNWSNVIDTYTIPQPPPTISSFSPISGAVGTSVTITGTNFDPTPANNIVYFGATKASVTTATTAQLTVTVPTGATYQPITVTTNGLTAYSSKPFIVTFPSSGIIDASSFATKVDFTTAQGESYFVGIGDLNGDGKSDMAVSNYTGATVSVLRNTSSPGAITGSSFAANVDFTPGTRPSGMTLGDLDGDGKLDMVVSNYTSSSVSIFQNTSVTGSITSGSFGSMVDLATTTRAAGAMIGDLDGDGKPDLVIANNDGTTVSVFQNIHASGVITTGSFAPKIDFTVGTNPLNVNIADLDADGKPELVVANGNSNNISVLKNNATSGSISAGSFAAAVNLTTGSGPTNRVGIGDLDGDGKPDLAVVLLNGNKVSVYRNISTSGTITTGSFAASVDFTTGTRPLGVALGDLDGDGKLEIAVVCESTNTVSVYKNTSTSGTITTSSFATKIDYPKTQNSYDVNIADMDGDGKPDLIVGNGNNSVSVFRNTIPITPTISSFAPISAGSGGTITITGTNFIGVTAVSFGGTAATSFNVVSATIITAIIATGTAGNVSVTTPGGTITSAGFTFIPAPTISSFAPTSAAVGATVTITGTNFTGATAVSFGGTAATSFNVVSSTSITAIVATGTSGSISVITPGGTATKTGFAFVPVPTITSFTPASGVIGATVTITGTNFDSNAANNIVYFGAVKATVSAATSTQLTVTVPMGATYQPITVTVNGLTAYARIPFLVTFQGGGAIDANSFVSKVDFSSGAYPYSIVAGDLDGDGKVDLASANYGGTNVGVIKNTSLAGNITSSSFATKVDFAFVASAICIAIGDLDGDGKLDLVAGSGTLLSVFRNTSTTGSIAAGSFASRVDFNTSSNVFGIAIGDLDGDGKPDIAMAAFGSVGVSILKNLSTSGVINSSSFATQVDFITGANSRGVAIGDLDGDGKSDLAVVNGVSSTVSVLRNISTFGTITTGSFASAINFDTGPNPYDVALGDIDGDGKLDIVVVPNNTNDVVSVYKNNAVTGAISANSFSARVDFETRYNPNSVAIGDLDGDGKVDLVVSSSVGTSILRNKAIIGTINLNSFEGKVDVTATANPGSLDIALADWDGDGKLDLAVADYSNNVLSIIRNRNGEAPTITSFNPTSGGVGTSVTITGTNFSTTPANNILKFNGTLATITGTPTASSITGTVPTGATSGTISVAVNGLTGTSSTNFTLIPPPTITSVNPTSAATGATVTITGTNFTGATAVSFGGTAATSFTVVSSTSITAIVAAGTTGSLSVTTPGGTVSSAGFTFIPTPTITSFNPTSAAAGATVTITGTNLTGATAVSFGGTAAASFAVSATSITTVVAAGTTGSVSVTTPGGTATKTGFTFTPTSLLITDGFITSYDKGSTLTENITVSDVSRVTSVTLKTRGISEPTSALKSFTLTAAGTKFEKVIATSDLADPIGIVFTFEIVDNTQTAAIVHSGKAYVKYPASSTEHIIPNLSFGDQVSNYQIIAVPLELTNKNVTSVLSALGTYDKTKWRLFDYASGDNREFPAFSTINTGKGYWLIARTSVTINPGEGTTVAADDTAPFTISLATGWNLIANPYNFRVSWTDVITANASTTGISGVGTKLKVFSAGTLADGDVLDKYRGAFVFSNNAAAMKIPVTRNTTLGGRTSSPINNAIDHTQWEVKLALANGALHNELGGIGMNPKATLLGKDAFDEVSVPLPDGLGLFEIAFPHPEVFTDFNKEVVPTQENYRWDFNVKRSSPGNLELSWENDYFGSNDKQLVLFDPTTLQIIDMRKLDHVVLTTSTNKLTILYGGPAYIEHALDANLPWLGSPYPNPAKEELTIPFRVPESFDQMPVKISIVNGTGTEVATPVNRTLGKGNYDVKWYPQGETGLYLIRMRIGQEETKTMKVVVK